MSVVITSHKGQVVIPKKEREKIGLKPGSKVRVEAIDNHIEIHLMPEDPIEYLCGIFEGYPGSLTQALLNDRKEDSYREEKKFTGLFRHTRPSKKRK
ncbi:MAG: AbrB/MazE/SpoVT family DNA-binding domain-containing protein [Nitrospirae bacterium]|nr:AbrB/MazE/SpoVT family DNA-binding domain-containing protein [Nitrospirota bacterium]